MITAPNIIKERSTHAAKLERFLTRDEVKRVADYTRGWYGSPIAVAAVPGNVRVGRGGEFVGKIEGGGFGSLSDLIECKMNALRRAFKRLSTAQRLTMGVGGFASLDELIAAETTDGRARRFQFFKTITATANQPGSFWAATGTPVAGAIAGAAPGGTAYDDTSTGAFVFDNPTGGMTQHLKNGAWGALTAGQTCLLYDRLFGVAHPMNSTSTVAVTGVPTRYQSTTPGDAEYCGNNFVVPEVFSTLANTAHNHLTLQYTDNDGNATQSAPSVAGVNSAAANRIDLVAPNWFIPLASGDNGLQKITQIQHSAAVATGTMCYTIGHPLAILPGPVLANAFVPLDWVNSALNMKRILDDACMSFIAQVLVGGTVSISGEVCTLAN